MSEDIKMGDVFELPLFTTPGGVMSFVKDDHGQVIVVADEPFAKGIAYAINNHDQLVADKAALVDALTNMVTMYVDLVESGDCGNWNPEKDEEVIAARATLAKVTGDK